ncbi:MAG: glycosyltransferase family 4 protein, partial [Candidatus Paceibacterota bacterium]
MRILQVHNRYKTPGGEWTVLNQEHGLLKENHEVDQFIIKNSDHLDTLTDKAKLIFKTHYNSQSKLLIKEQLQKGKYDVMHVHNFFPLLTPSIFEAARELGVPSVLTLHNYRLIHPNGLMYHKGKIDHRSIKGSAYNCVWDGVYRNSKLQTAVVAHMIEYHRKKGTWNRFPTAFIALSKFSKNKFAEGGIPADRIFIKPNFLKDPCKEDDDLEISSEKLNRFLFLGRISNEKGIEDLIRCWMERSIPAELWIAGEGPLKKKLQKKTKGEKSIKWLGQCDKKDVLKLLSNSKALLFPTKWYEGMPLIILEAMSMGCPVISSDIGNPKNMIDHKINGLLFEPGKMAELY